MDGWMDVARMAYGVQTYGLSRLERLMVTHRRYIILERMLWDGQREEVSVFMVFWDCLRMIGLFYSEWSYWI